MTDTTRPHPSQRRYPPELRESTVRLVHERIAETGGRQGVVTRVARQLGVTIDSVRQTVTQCPGRTATLPLTETSRDLA